MAGYCPGCGKPVSDDARFCSSCGRALTSVPAPPGGYPPMTFPGLVRPRAGKKIAGVCRGIANRTGWDVTLLRVLFVILGVIIFPIWIIVYLIFWMIMPEEPIAPPAPRNYPGEGQASTSPPSVSSPGIS